MRNTRIALLAIMLAVPSASSADMVEPMPSAAVEAAPPAAPPDVDDLRLALERSAPALDDAYLHVEAARSASGPIEVRGRWYEVTPEILLSMAWVESRYVPTAVSRLECDAAGCHRRTGAWAASFPKRFQGPYFCGYLQARATSERACRALGADLGGAYLGAVAHLRDWLRFCTGDRVARRHHDRIGCALAGYNGGVRAARELRPRYPRAVRDRAARLGRGWRS